MENPLGLDGVEFLEFCADDEKMLAQKFKQFGMTEVAHHKSLPLKLFRQNDINLVVNQTENSFASEFKKMHGPSICGMGMRVKNAQQAFSEAVKRGARPFTGGEKVSAWPLSAIYGIGDSLVYFVDQYTPSPNGAPTFDRGDIYKNFQFNSENHYPTGNNLIIIDHLTNNVPRGEMNKWSDFYEKIFGFKEKKYFDIRGKKTGLISKAMQSPCKKFSIPINEPTEGYSQIQEYLDEYKGPGIQHVAFLTDNICREVEALGKMGVEFLDRPTDTYYEMLPGRLPNVKENLTELKRLAILADGDREGYLLQLFTKNQFGPIFIELIQRRGHDGFGDGNFQALFDAMEADQAKRGVL